MSRALLGTFGRYVGVQLLAYAIDMGVFLLASHAGAGPIPANIAAKLAAGLFAFVVHRRMTFGVHGQPGVAGQALRYGLLLALNVPLASGVLALLLPWIAPAALAKFVADVICVGLTFVLSRQLVFRPTAARDPRA